MARDLTGSRSRHRGIWDGPGQGKSWVNLGRVSEIYTNILYTLVIWVIYWFCRAIQGNILGTTASVPCQGYPNLPFDYGMILGKSGVAFLRKKSGRGGREAEEDWRREEGVAPGSFRESREVTQKPLVVLAVCSAQLSLVVYLMRLYINHLLFHLSLREPQHTRCIPKPPNERNSFRKA